MIKISLESDKLILEFDKKKDSEELKYVSLISNFDKFQNKYVLQYEKDVFFLIIKLLKKRNVKYLLDNNLKEILNVEKESEKDFRRFSNHALAIKNNTSNFQKNFLDFTNTIRKLLVRRLYDFQLKASFHMAYSLNSCNFSVPGSGKTSIVYGAYAYLKEKKCIDKLLVIGPLSSSAPWRNEFQECFGYKSDFKNLSYLDSNQKINYLESHKSVQKELNFINYEGFSNILGPLKNFIKKNKVMIVLDEAHKIKNPEALRSRLVMELSISSVSRIVLTGTPMPNGYNDLYNLFEFIWPKKNIIGFNENQLKEIEKTTIYREKIITLMSNIDPFYIRIKKSDLNLQNPNYHDPIFVEMGDYQKKIYDFIAEDFIKSSLNDYDYETRQELRKAKLIRLLQSLTNPGAIGKSISDDNQDYLTGLKKMIVDYDNYEIPSKYLELLSLVKKILKRNEKVIIWTVYIHNITKLSEFLMNHGIFSEKLYGEIDNDLREVIIDRFHSDSNMRVLIANPSAVAESISLHKVCNNAIYLDKDFNAANYMQSKDRIHRVGMPKKKLANYYYLISKNSIDELVHQRVLDKEKKMISVIEGREIPLFDSDFSSNFSSKDLTIIENYLRGN